MIENWKRILSVRAAEWGLPVGGEWNSLFLNTYNAPCPTINLLWFYGNEQFPRVVTKMCRDDASLVEEFRNLQALHSLAPRHVPKPFCLGNADGFCMLWMEGVPGRRVPPDGQHALDASVDMLTSIHRAVNKGKEGSASERHERMVTAPLNAVLQRGGSAVRERCLALSEAATAQWLQDLPVIPQHGDLYSDNILRYRDQCHIVDWEDFGKIDLPFYDLLTLLIGFLRASTTAQDGWDPHLKRVIPSLVERYAGAVKLPISMVSRLLPLTMANLFYLHWIEGKPAAEVVYADIEHYFARTSYWEEVFLRKEHL